MVKVKTIVYKLSDNTMSEMKEHYDDIKREKTPPYAVFQADAADTVVTLYESGKAVFQGVNPEIDADLWEQREFALNGKKVLNQSKDKKEENKVKDNTDYYFINSIGSDEVGTGDYFGPIVVTAAYVNKKEINFLESLGVRDSKKINDEKILKIAPEIIKRIPHSIIILSNSEYNKNYSSDVNMNKIKAVMHNKALLTLIEKDNYAYDMIVVDQFVNKNKYYDYLKASSKVLNNLTFTTKAEDKCLSVACGSIISRYLFLKEMDKLSNALGFTIPKGAGSEADQAGKIVIEKFGVDKLNSIAKLNFKNTQRILEK